MGYPQKGHGTSGIMGWRWGTLPGGGQSENITSCCTTYAGGNNFIRHNVFRVKITAFKYVWFQC